jgi:hypothetical protein
MKLLSKPVIAMLMVFCLLLIPLNAFPFFTTAPETYPNLQELADAVAGEMKDDLKGKRLYLDRSEIRDERDGSIGRFSFLLANELERALSKSGFVFEGAVPGKYQTETERQKAALLGDLTDYKLMVGYSKDNEKVRVHIKLRENKGMTVRSLKNSYALAVASLPAVFSDNLENRLDTVVSRICGPLKQQQQIGVYVPLLLESRKKYPSPFSEYATGRIKALLAECPPVKVIDDKESVEKLVANRVLKQTSPEAASGAADALLEGSYLRSMRKSINLSITLKDAEGRTLSRVDEEIPLALISYSLENSAAETLAQLTDIEHESGKGMVTLETARGGDYQLFHEGEIVSFRLRVAKPLYIYVYNINSSAEATLLYPRPDEREQPKTPGITYNLPDSSDSWEIKVTPPFGTDAVKVFASDRHLPLPDIRNNVATRSFSRGIRGLAGVEKVRKELAVQKVISGYDLVDWYKGIAARTGGPLYEATLYIETRPR